jgi:hypothetical protein
MVAAQHAQSNLDTLALVVAPRLLTLARKHAEMDSGLNLLPAVMMATLRMGTGKLFGFIVYNINLDALLLVLSKAVIFVQVDHPHQRTHVQTSVEMV